MHKETCAHTHGPRPYCTYTARAHTYGPCTHTRPAHIRDPHTHGLLPYTRPARIHTACAHTRGPRAYTLPVLIHTAHAHTHSPCPHTHSPCSYTQPANAHAPPRPVLIRPVFIHSRAHTNGLRPIHTARTHTRQLSQVSHCVHSRHHPGSGVRVKCDGGALWREQIQAAAAEAT